MQTAACAAVGGTRLLPVPVLKVWLGITRNAPPFRHSTGTCRYPAPTVAGAAFGGREKHRKASPSAAPSRALAPALHTQASRLGFLPRNTKANCSQHPTVTVLPWQQGQDFNNTHYHFQVLFSEVKRKESFAFKEQWRFLLIFPFGRLHQYLLCNV